MSRHRATTKMATCCPLRKAVAGGLCALHMERTLTVELSAVEAPSACPHCHATDDSWVGNANYRSCIHCGEDWERHVAVVA